MLIKKILAVRPIIFAGSVLIQLSTVCFSTHGAAGDVDLSFDPGSGVNGTVNAVAVQGDGKVIVAGQFTTVKGLARKSMARLDTTGEGDPSFDAGTNVDEFVSAVAALPDGKVIFTRDFYNFNGAPPGHKVARLNADGTLDATFVPDTGTFPLSSGLTCMAVQPDGKVVVGGYYNGVLFGSLVRRSLLLRLNANGTSDTTFTNGNGTFGGQIFSMALQADGKILIGGSIYATVHGTNRFDVVRLNADGSVDEGFEPAVGGYVRVLAVQPDGKSLVGGSLIGSGTNRHGMARLNENGSLDAGFDPSADGIHTIASIRIAPQTGALVVSGSYWETDEEVRTKVVRLHANGTVDNSFNVGRPDLPNDSGVATALQPDGKLFVAGAFTVFGESRHQHIVRLNTNGSLDTAFDPGAGINGTVNTIIRQPDGKLLLRGSFTAIQQTSRNRVARLNPGGGVDTTFDSGSGVSGGFFRLEISAIAAQPDGKVMIGGDFSSISGINRYRLARLNSNGTVDSNFVSGTGGIGFDGNPVQSIAVLPDGRMLIAEPGGVNGLSSPRKIARLDSTGNVDTNFNPVIAAGLPGAYHTLADVLTVQPDGKTIVAGTAQYDDLQYHAALLLRFNADGSVDSSFLRSETAGPSVITFISALVLQPDGKVLIGGNFTEIQGSSRNGIARLNADGTLDTTFDPGSGVGDSYDPAVFAIQLQPDGRILIGGSFAAFNGIARNNIARLNANGSLDGSFSTGGGTDSAVHSIVSQPDGSVLIGGSFNTADGVVRPKVARLVSDWPALSIARSNTFVIVAWPDSATGFQLQETTNFSLPNPWSPVAQPAVTNSGRIAVTVPTFTGSKFFRLNSR